MSSVSDRLTDEDIRHIARIIFNVRRRLAAEPAPAGERDDDDARLERSGS